MSIISDDEWNKHVESIADLHDQSPTEDTPNQICQRCGGAVPPVSGEVLKRTGRICTGLHSPVIEQDDKKLRPQLYALLHKYFNGKQWYDGEIDQTLKAIEALFTTAQLQLVTELRSAIHDLEACNPPDAPLTKHIHAHAVNDILQRKKQELERGE